MLNSDYARLCSLPLPAPTRGRQHYMHAFDLRNPTVPEGFEDYLPVVRRAAKATGRGGIAYLTVDEKVVAAGATQRRPGPHVDGCFSGRAWVHPPTWMHDGHPRMAVVVASSVPGCRVWRGVFRGTPADDGDLSHIAEQLQGGELLPAGAAYLLSPDCVHESLPMLTATPRTFLRIALPVGRGA